MSTSISIKRVKSILDAAAHTRVLVHVMLDHFIWGNVSRISPEAPVPVVDFNNESYMPGGAANVARNLSALNAKADMFSAIGEDGAGRQLKALLGEQHVGCAGLVATNSRPTSIKTRIVA